MVLGFHKSSIKIIFKFACIFMFLFIGIMTFGSILGYLRAVRTRPINISTFNQPDVIMAHIGILNNVKADTTFISNYANSMVNFNLRYNDDCNCGFVGDTAVVSLLSLTLVINVINIFVIIASFFTRHQRFLWILLFSSSIGTVFLIAAVIVFSVNYNQIWFYQEDTEITYDSHSLTIAKREWNYYYDIFPYEIDYDYSVYLTITNILISALSIVLPLTFIPQTISSSSSSISFPASDSH